MDPLDDLPFPLDADVFSALLDPSEPGARSYLKRPRSASPPPIIPAYTSSVLPSSATAQIIDEFVFGAPPAFDTGPSIAVPGTGGPPQPNTEGPTNERVVKRRVVKPREDPPGAVVTEKSCKRCRERKVKCDRMFPLCNHCKERGEDCDLKDLFPTPKEEKKKVERERIKQLEKRLAELEAQLPSAAAAAPTSVPASNSSSSTGSIHSTPSPVLPLHALPPTAFALPSSGTASSLVLATQASPAFPDPFNVFLPYPKSDGSSSPGDSPPMLSSIGHTSLDWRLAVPQLEWSLTQNLCDAFFDSCCFLLPSFSYFMNKLVDSNGSYRLSNIESQFTDHDLRDTKELLSAGRRRQTACSKLVELAQLSSFNELEPKRARSLLRSALGQFKELQDLGGDKEKESLRKSFGFALYTADCLTSACSRRAPLISDIDLQAYFTQSGIVIPSLPSARLSPVLRNLLANAGTTRHSGFEGKFKTATHLIACWTAALQRMFLKAIGNRRHKSSDTASPAELLRFLVSPWPPLSLHGTGSSHVHEHDFVALAIRSDRDILDLNSILHQHLLEKGSEGPWKALREESESRVRRGLKTLAFYFKVYLTGADGHMIFHAVFQMEHNPDWVQMALQRVGETPGPKDETEEVSQLELSWFIEGLQHSCYYSPGAEKRLAELDPRFSTIGVETPPPAYQPEKSGASSPFRDFGTEKF
ncbi:hypothetical protein MNV49_001179 [Pseudohyphozyma bogoriensis]|nr:hypothetical protein MNV49_001179 [Pseudohyphozyma bogoriensis]